MSGRPSLYSEELADAICGAIAEGSSLRQICDLEGMPARRTVLEWLERYEDFRAKYARAREHQADVMDDLILHTADACDSENYQAARVKIGAYQWRASKLRPKVYGDKVQQEISGPGGGPVRLVWGDGSDA